MVPGRLHVYAEEDSSVFSTFSENFTVSDKNIMARIISTIIDIIVVLEADCFGILKKKKIKVLVMSMYKGTYM